MESDNAPPNPAANQLPGADSLPDGFVDSSTDGSYAPMSPRIASLHAPELTDYKEDTLLEPELRPGVIVNHIHFDAPSDSVRRDADDEVGVEVQGSPENSIRNQQAPTKKEMLPQESSEHQKIEASEGKRKNAKRGFKSEKEFLEFTLRYQQVITERDSAIAVRDRLESLCRELQRQNKTLMDECKRVSTEGQNLRLDISNKFRDAIKEVSNKMEEQKDECLSQLKENETLKCKLKQVAEQYAVAEEQFNLKLKQKDLELQIAELKIKQHEEKILQEESKMKMYAEQVSELLATEKNLRVQLTADGEKFQQFQEALSKSNDVFEGFKVEVHKMSKSIKELRKENALLKSKCENSDIALVKLAEEREHMKKQLERTRNQKEKLESLCRSLQAERKASSTAIGSGSDSVSS
ncbi:hypothetical protein DM860_006350 [Cuscuta australis]|uniref:Alpha-taxilin n=2 Tax=Cuscuta sect. Cleistogrammica TaxID=1824901 RepID=A0A328D561_9ASTE|nr:hypothetical protein DM860_006350 [Cuscuta australis]